MMDYEDLIDEYGESYLSDKSPDDALLEMEMINELFETPLDAIERTFYGGRYGWEKDSFNPNDEFFYYNGYGNLVSVNEYDRADYLLSVIGEDNEDFLEWGRDNYPDDFEDEEDDDEEDEE